MFVSNCPMLCGALFDHMTIRAFSCSLEAGCSSEYTSPRGNHLVSNKNSPQLVFCFWSLPFGRMASQRPGGFDGLLCSLMRNNCANCEVYQWKQQEDKITLRCGGCKIFFYCSKECQEEHWKKTHRQHCTHLSRLKEIEPNTMNNDLGCRA